VISCSGEMISTRDCYDNCIGHTSALTVFSSRAFSAEAPARWNSLDINTQSAETFLTFRRKLNTELYKILRYLNTRAPSLRP